MSQELSYLISYAFKYLYPEMQYSKDSNRPTMKNVVFANVVNSFVLQNQA